MQLEPGSQIDRYKIEAIIGEGGMGRVCKAFDTRLHRRVALKVLHPADGTEAADAVATALREARNAAAIAHPNATAVYDADEIDGSPYIVMEFVPGTSLRQIISGPPASLTLRLRWLVDIAGALAAAHQVGIVHRDVKPENVMVRDDGLVKVLDFGVARRTVSGTKTHDSRPGDNMASTPDGSGRLVGTPAYMPPEQIRGESIDGRADQFAWGVLAYELLTGRLPWKSAREFLGYIAAVLTEKPEPPRTLVPEIPPAVEAAILRALSKNPSNRFPNMAAAAAELLPFTQDVTGPLAITPASLVDAAPVEAPHRTSSRQIDPPRQDRPRSPLTTSPAAESIGAGRAPLLPGQPPPMRPEPPPSAPRLPHAPLPPHSHPPHPPHASHPPLAHHHAEPPFSRPPSEGPLARPAPRWHDSPRPSRLDRLDHERVAVATPVSGMRAVVSGPPSSAAPSEAPGTGSSIPPARSSVPMPQVPPVPAPTMPSGRRALPEGYHKLHEPNFEATIDVDAHLAFLPRDAKCKGLFFVDLVRMGSRAATYSELARAAHVTEQRYTKFMDYPAADNLRLTVAVARAMFPKYTLGEALRRLGQMTFDNVLGTQLGRSTLGIHGSEIEKMLLASPKMLKHLLSFGRLTVEKAGAHSILFRAKELPVFLETFAVGVLEGALRHCRAQGKIRVAVDDPGSGLAEVRLGP